METVLIVITLASVATTIAALASLRRLRRQERERSDARVAALSAAATERIPNPHAPLPSGLPDRFFGSVERDEPNSQLPVLAAAAAIALVGGALIFLNTTASDNGTAAGLPTRAQPLELIALGHTRDATLLTISGTIRNPSGGIKLDDLTAVVSFLDGSGALLSTGNVPLDYRTLGPGEETPFRLSIPDPGSLARYRVSFRAGAALMPHIDRRSHAKLASVGQ